MIAMEDEMKRAEDLIKARKDHQEKQATASSLICAKVSM
jgi:hypothetical protein